MTKNNELKAVLVALPRQMIAAVVVVQVLVRFVRSDFAAPSSRDSDLGPNASQFGLCFDTNCSASNCSCCCVVVAGCNRFLIVVVCWLLLQNPFPTTSSLVHGHRPSASRPSAPSAPGFRWYCCYCYCYCYVHRWCRSIRVKESSCHAAAVVVTAVFFGYVFKSIVVRSLVVFYSIPGTWIEEIV